MIISPTYKNEILKLELFSHCTPDQFANLIHGGEIKILKHREVLRSAGDIADHFFIVILGAIKLIRLNALGDESIVYFACPGDALAAFLMNQTQARYPVSMKSMGNSTVLSIPKKTFTEFWSHNQKLQHAIGQAVFSRMNQLQEEKSQIKVRLEKKIIILLLNLLERGSVSDSDPNEIDIPLTRQEIADALGATVESVIRIMSEWTQLGLIHVNEKHIVIDQVSELLARLEE